MKFKNIHYTKATWRLYPGSAYFWLLAILPDVSISYMVCSRHFTSSVGQRTRAAKAEAKEPAAAFCRSLGGCKHRQPVTHSLRTGQAPPRMVKQSELRRRGTLLQCPPGFLRGAHHPMGARAASWPLGRMILKGWYPCAQSHRCQVAMLGFKHRSLMASPCFSYSSYSCGLDPHPDSSAGAFTLHVTVSGGKSLVGN